MSLNESIVEAAALEWFGEQGGGRVKSEERSRKSEIMEFISCFTFRHSLFPIPRHPARHAAAEAAERGVERSAFPKLIVTAARD
jgi:hypothetical protein